MEFTIKPASKASSRDRAQALTIYVRTTDSGSDTDTNQIIDYIDAGYEEDREMFFYILYVDRKVVGFAEFAYLPKTEVLVIDYLSTDQRSPVYFYTFYNMLLERIKGELSKDSKFVKYIVTEISAREQDGRLVDVDSVYFLRLLSMEQFAYCKAPYYQPSFKRPGKLKGLRFCLAIKPYKDTLTQARIALTKEVYLDIVRDIYECHYGAWYSHYLDPVETKETMESLYKRICNEYPTKLELESVYAVNCQLFNEGKCSELSFEPVTVKSRNRAMARYITITCVWLALCTVTLVLVIVPELSTIAKVISSFLTIVAGVVALIQFGGFSLRK